VWSIPATQHEAVLHEIPTRSLIEGFLVSYGDSINQELVRKSKKDHFSDK
jgi:hypothetical protein